jgi:uncharacterized membrane-anchored protein YhcB (DUF1043 family)
MSEEKAEHTTDTSPEDPKTGTGGETGASTEETVAADRYKNLQSDYTKKAQELAEQREQRAKLEGELQALRDTSKQNTPEPLPRLADNEELLERFKDDPSTIAPYIDELESRWEQRHYSDLQRVVAHVTDQMTQLTPEFTKRKELIEKLDANPATKNWTAKDKLDAAIAMEAALDTPSKPSEDPDSPEWKGGSGAGRRVDAGTTGGGTEHEKLVKSIADKTLANIRGNQNDKKGFSI